MPAGRAQHVRTASVLDDLYLAARALVEVEALFGRPSLQRLVLNDCAGPSVILIAQFTRV